jgi:hypothetical protein
MEVEVIAVLTMLDLCISVTQINLEKMTKARETNSRIYEFNKSVQNVSHLRKGYTYQLYMYIHQVQTYIYIHIYIYIF